MIGRRAWRASSTSSSTATGTVGATSIAQADYGLQAWAREMNLASARLAREACDRYATADRPRFVAGALGPIGFTG